MGKEGTDRVHLHGEDGSAAADIENNLVLEEMTVLSDGVHVGPRADLVFLSDSIEVSRRPLHWVGSQEAEARCAIKDNWLWRDKLTSISS